MAANGCRVPRARPHLAGVDVGHDTDVAVAVQGHLAVGAGWGGVGLGSRGRAVEAARGAGVGRRIGLGLRRGRGGRACMYWPPGGCVDALQGTVGNRGAQEGGIAAEKRRGGGLWQRERGGGRRAAISATWGARAHRRPCRPRTQRSWPWPRRKPGEARPAAWPARCRAMGKIVSTHIASQQHPKRGELHSPHCRRPAQPPGWRCQRRARPAAPEQGEQPGPCGPGRQPAREWG